MESKENHGCKVYGYARVSSIGQNLDRQIEELKKYVPLENIVTDKQSGKDLNHPGYQALKGTLGLRKGDTLYIKSWNGYRAPRQILRQNWSGFKRMEYG